MYVFYQCVATNPFFVFICVSSSDLTLQNLSVFAAVCVAACASRKRMLWFFIAAVAVCDDFTMFL